MSEEQIVVPRAEYESLLATNARLAQAVQNLEEQLRLARRQRFGTKSEQSKYDDGSEQLGMELVFNEVEFYADHTDPTEAVEPELTVVKAPKQKKHATNKEKLPENIETEVVIRDVPESERICPQCGTQMRSIGEDVVRRLKIVPAKVVIVETHLPRYACANCEQNDITTPVVSASSTPGFLPGSMATPEAVAWVIVQKYVMYSPLYRLEQELSRMGVQLSRQTMSKWLTLACEKYLKPIYALLKKRVQAAAICHADETTLQVLHEPNRSPQQKSYMWLFRTGKYAEHPAIVYEYHETRRAEHPQAFFRDFKGYVHTDGYAGYHDLPEGITVVGCMAHARRKFDEALKAISPNDRASSKAMKGKRYCDALFSLEDKWESLTPAERYEQRQKQSAPLLTEFHEWLESLHPSPKSAFGRAVAYTLEQWPWLCNYLLDGRLEISNNLAERSVKPFVMGRKNFLFANTPSGARDSAILYSLVETAKEWGLNPYRYLVSVLNAAPLLDLSDEQQVEQLMPEVLLAGCGTMKN